MGEVCECALECVSLVADVGAHVVEADVADGAVELAGRPHVAPAV